MFNSRYVERLMPAVTVQLAFHTHTHPHTHTLQFLDTVAAAVDTVMHKDEEEQQEKKRKKRTRCDPINIATLCIGPRENGSLPVCGRSHAAAGSRTNVERGIMVKLSLNVHSSKLSWCRWELTQLNPLTLKKKRAKTNG